MREHIAIAIVVSSIIAGIVCLAVWLGRTSDNACRSLLNQAATAQESLLVVSARGSCASQLAPRPRAER